MREEISFQPFLTKMRNDLYNDKKQGLKPGFTNPVAATHTVSQVSLKNLLILFYCCL